MTLLQGAERDEFFQQVIASLPARLPPVWQGDVNFTKFKPGRDWLSVGFLSYPRIQYRLRIRQHVIEMALYVGGEPENRQRILDFLAEPIKTLEQELEYPLVQGSVSKLWSRVGVEINSIFWEYTLNLGDDDRNTLPNSTQLPTWMRNKEQDGKHEYLQDFFGRFLITTIPWLTEIQRFFPLSHNIKAGGKSEPGEDEAVYLAAEKYIEQIRQFLSGRNGRKPSEEQLCDWVQFCYLFGLYAEGAHLFELVNAQALNNDWFYQRTKNYAKSCRLKAKPPSTG